MNGKGKFPRFYGNRNKIVRVRNEWLHSVVYLVSSKMNCTYREAFEMTTNFLTSKEPFGLDMVERIVALNKNQ